MTPHPRMAALLALFLALAVSGRAQAAGDLDLFIGDSVPPNVMLIIDNSGSMSEHLWDDDFIPQKVYPSTCWVGSTIGGSSCPGLGNPGDECPNHLSRVTYDPSLGATTTVTCGAVTRTLYLDI